MRPNDENEPIVFQPQPRFDRRSEIEHFQERLRTREVQRWQAAVDETVRAWDIPRADAEATVAELYREAHDQAQLRLMTEEMPEWQKAMLQMVQHTADILSFRLLIVPPLLVERLREGLAEYDAAANQHDNTRTT